LGKEVRAQVETGAVRGPAKLGLCVRSEAELSEEEAKVVALVGLGSRVVVPIDNMQVNNYI